MFNSIDNNYYAVKGMNNTSRTIGNCMKIEEGEIRSHTELKKNYRLGHFVV